MRLLPDPPRSFREPKSPCPCRTHFGGSGLVVSLDSVAVFYASATVSHDWDRCEICLQDVATEARARQLAAAMAGEGLSCVSWERDGDTFAVHGSIVATVHTPSRWSEREWERRDRADEQAATMQDHRDSLYGGDA